MFTGIIATLGEVVTLARRGDSARLEVRPLAPFVDLAVGESVAVNGACLTVTTVAGALLAMDVSHETLERTTLGRLRVGARLNLERALRPVDRLGGHLVQGHVDGVVKLRSMAPSGPHVELTVEKPREAAHLLVEKGSVALDGVSLTAARLEADCFTVAMLRFTLDNTTFRDRRPGDELNVEWDLLAKYVAANVAGARGGIDEDFLRKHGF